ncbi:hypothetical protein LTR56_024287 [Elasticomyces elasticus]|nr:hypothetical protein LTR56_024287 [Elasticomyces elasticus]
MGVQRYSSFVAEIPGLIAPAALRCRAIHPLQFSDDLTFYSVEFLAWSQIQMGSAIIFAALPTCVGVLLKLHTGLGAISESHELRSMPSQTYGGLSLGKSHTTIRATKRERSDSDSEKGIMTQTGFGVMVDAGSSSAENLEATTRNSGDT